MSIKARRRRWQEGTTLEDRIDIKMETLGGRLVAFSVNYSIEAAEGPMEVIRFDTHHGRLHVHRFWRTPEDQIEYLEPQPRGPQDYTQEFEGARGDLQANWKRYRTLVEDRAPEAEQGKDAR